MVQNWSWQLCLVSCAFCRHIDHSVGLQAAAEDISKARSTAADTDSTGSKGQQQTAADAAEALPPVVFDLHPKRPYRRGLELPQGLIPWNFVSSARPGGFKQRAVLHTGVRQCLGFPCGWLAPICCWQHH